MGVSERPAVTEPGLYEVAGNVYLVRPTRDGQRLYAEQLYDIQESGIIRQYVSGIVYVLQPEDRMTRARAIELIRQCRRCLVCGRRLKDPNSYERGMGPVCGKYLPRS